jgi:ribosomal protein S18 acetylase RimI-like enzyme
VDPADIRLGSEWDPQLDAFLAERIYAFNARTTGQADGAAVTGAIRDATGRVVAAVTGHTWGGACQVNSLWVDEAHRRQGLGRALLGAVEAEARRRGCAQVILLTHDFQAPAFYEGLGYARRAEIPGYPRGHAQYVYVKPLAAPDGA